MNKLLFIAVLLAVALVVYWVVSTNQVEEVKEKQLENKTNETKQKNVYTLDYVNSLALKPDKVDIDEVISIIDNANNSYVRERAVFLLKEVATRQNKTDVAVDYLTSLVNKERDPQVLGASYSVLSTIYEENNFEDNIEVSIDGRKVSIFINLTALKDIEVRAFITRVVDMENDKLLLEEDFEDIDGLKVISMKKGEQKTLDLSLTPKKQGTYSIRISIRGDSGKRISMFKKTYNIIASLGDKPAYYVVDTS